VNKSIRKKETKNSSSLIGSEFQFILVLYYSRFNQNDIITVSHVIWHINDLFAGRSLKKNFIFPLKRAFNEMVSM